MAETSSSSNTRILDKSIGLNTLIPIIIFSIGYSANWNTRNNIIPSNSNAKNSQMRMAMPRPFALSRVSHALRNARAVNTIVLNIPAMMRCKPDTLKAKISIGIPAPTINASKREMESPVKILI